MQTKFRIFAPGRLTARSAMAAVLAVGGIAAPGFALAQTAGQSSPGDQAKTSRKIDKQVAVAERAVAKSPQDVEARSRLAQTYLAAGRFTSASTSFEDAVSLGDKSPATALGMALSYIGTGRNQEATALLGQWRESMPASDYGLALALAGQPAQAAAILSDVIKQGENTPKLRQNLAYAFALGGHLQEARVVAAQDVPADQLEARVSDWALQASVGSSQSRIAALLGAPVRSDPGQPALLALGAKPESAMMAASEVAPQQSELPALTGDAPPPAFAEAQAASQPAPKAPVALAAAEPASVPAALAEASPAVRQFVSNPVVQDISSRVEARTRMAAASTPTPLPAPRAPRPAAPKAPPIVPAGNHLVQLGSFTTEAGARRAWNIFVSRDPSLRDRELRISEAMVNGRRYFRVAAAGYEAAEARDKCSSLRGRGGDCLAMASSRLPAGALPVGALAGRLARR